MTEKHVSHLTRTRLFRRDNFFFKYSLWCSMVALWSLAYISMMCIYLLFPQTVWEINTRPPQLSQYPSSIMQREHYLARAYHHDWVGFPNLKLVNCPQALVRKTPNDWYPAKVFRPSLVKITSDVRNCTAFKAEYGFERYPPVTKEELDFPLAFIFLVHKDLDQILYLLRAIYHPHNVHCISVDLNSGKYFLNTLTAITECLPNVFVARKLTHIVYAGFNRVMADIYCMKELMDHPVSWKYVMNIPGQQFPLRTNLEIVRILKYFNGTNDIEGYRDPNKIRSQRFKHIHKVYKRKVVPTRDLKSSPPHDLIITKGSAYGTFTREFIKFVLTSKVSADFMDWLQDIYSPDEYIWATLNYADHIDVPGGSKDPPKNHLWLTSHALWIFDKAIHQCATRYVHYICIFSTADLPWLMHRRELTANKFYVEHHPTALHCLDQFIYNLTVVGKTRDLSFYKNISRIWASS